MVHACEFGAQQIVDAPVAEATAHMVDLDDLGAQGLVHLCFLGRVAVAVAGEPHEAAGAALGQVELLHHGRDRRALGLWG